MEREIYKNVQAIVETRPDTAAFNIMKGLGCTAVALGEVLHILECVPVEVAIRQTNFCYNQLPVSWNNESYFLAPKTRVLLKQGTQVTCTKLMPPMFLLGSQWFSMDPEARRSPDPMQLKPDTKTTWVFEELQDLANSGIYTTEELGKLREHMMFPQEKASILSNLARAAVGEKTELKNINLIAMFDEYTVNHIIQTAWTANWARFMGFGTFTAGVIIPLH